MTQAIRRIEGGLEVRVHLQPNASKSGFVGLHGDRLKVRVQAKPLKGAANAALIELIAKTAGVARSAVELIRGAASREKDLRISCDDPEAAAEKLREAASS